MGRYKRGQLNTLGMTEKKGQNSCDEQVHFGYETGHELDRIGQNYDWVVYM